MTASNCHNSGLNHLSQLCKTWKHLKEYIISTCTFILFFTFNETDFHISKFCASAFFHRGTLRLMKVLKAQINMRVRQKTEFCFFAKQSNLCIYCSYGIQSQVRHYSLEKLTHYPSLYCSHKKKLKKSSFCVSVNGCLQRFKLSAVKRKPMLYFLKYSVIILIDRSKLCHFSSFQQYFKLKCCYLCLSVLSTFVDFFVC